MIRPTRTLTYAKRISCQEFVKRIKPPTQSPRLYVAVKRLEFKRTMIVHRRSLTFVKSERGSITGTALPSLKPSPAPAISGACFASLSYRPISSAVITGRQPVGLRLGDLVRNDVWTDWNEQQRWIERLLR
jgi:hypothetical protein